MRKWNLLWAALNVAVLCCTAAAQERGETMWLKANGVRLKSVVYRSARSSGPPVLVVVLHGDLPLPSYHYRFAREAAKTMDNMVVAALLRPGYTDGEGERSEGKMGLTTGDNYTPEVVDAVAHAVKQLKDKFQPARTVMVGHSGGAAITGDLLGRWPMLADAALMVSCPCDVPAWRRHMLTLQRSAIWLTPITSLSPMDLADKTSRSVRAMLLVGSDDPVAPPELSRRYADKLRSQGVDVTLTVLPGLKHNIFLEPAVLNELKEMVVVANQGK